MQPNGTLAATEFATIWALPSLSKQRKLKWYAHLFIYVFYIGLFAKPFGPGMPNEMAARTSFSRT